MLLAGSSCGKSQLQCSARKARSSLARGLPDRLAAPLLFAACLLTEAGKAGAGRVAVPFPLGAMAINGVCSYFRARGRLRDLVRDGRAMLDRLGW